MYRRSRRRGPTSRDYLIVGLNGETPSNLGEDPRFNYSYINYMGRSTYKGFPATDRESPGLIGEALDELRSAYPVGRYFVGGHSQGGWLTYSILMNFPEKIAGAFPISCGLLFQCEPDAFEDEALRAAQRLVPLAIVHARNDPVQDFGMARHAAGQFNEHGWPGRRLFADDSSGHMFMRLPVGEAIRWLEAMASDDPDVLLPFARTQSGAGHDRDAIAALQRLEGLKQTDAQKQEADALRAAIDAKARPKAEAFLSKIKANADGSWIDDFLAFRDEYEFDAAARPAMEAFEALRKQQEPAARKTYQEAIMLFRQGKRDEGHAKYREIVEKSYASSRYRDVKRRLDERK